MKNRLQMKALGLAALLGVGMILAGCKSAPELTKEQALKLVQAKYDATAPAGATVVVNDDGMIQGATGKLWDRVKVYPNKYWADFKLTDTGKKAVKLANGGDTIEWRPSSPTDKSFTVTVTTIASNHLKAKEMGDISDTTVVGVDTAKVAKFNEAVDWTGVPDVVQQIAHNPGNSLSEKRTAEFALENGAWVLHDVK
ncbi:MAG: hypothetical protein P4L40_21910 [Terracidiphilus sp.]|nr:hypothetical protein [Terracidiphilus sp.]